MKNKIMFLLCLGFMAVSALSFADDKLLTAPKESAGELAVDKAVFNHDQGVYNDKANKDIRTQVKKAKKTEINKQYNFKVQSQQDVNKGQFIVKF